MPDDAEKYSHIPSIYIHLNKLAKYCLYKDEEEEKLLLNSLRFLRIVFNHNDSGFVTMLINHIKKEIYIDALFSLVERGHKLPKEIIVEVLWLFIGFFNSSKNLIVELMSQEAIQDFSKLLVFDDIEILENVM